MVSWKTLFFTPHETSFKVIAVILWIVEAFLSVMVVTKVPYTEIDWSTYMQQVAIYDKGERNYTKIEGDTGPCVYPAGHLVLFSFLRIVTSRGRDILTAQYLFILFYLINLALVFRLYHKSRVIPPFVLVFLSLTGYRIHSIFMLRLFNDPLAMLLFYGAANLFVSQQWFMGCILYSLAVSVKMNVLLFAPALFFLLLTNTGIVSTFWHLAVCAFIQFSMALPFLAVDPFAYIQRSFDLGRLFLFKWTVNWRFLPETVFLDRRLHILLLILHVSALVYLAFRMWFRCHGGLVRSLQHLQHGIRTRIGVSESLYALFTANLVGIAFARSLHYQFYSWYFHQLPFLLFRNSSLVDGKVPWLNIAWKSVILLCVEYSWNVFPSTSFSSLLLHFSHAVIVYYLLITRSPMEKPTKSKLF